MTIQLPETLFLSLLIGLAKEHFCGFVKPMVYMSYLKPTDLEATNLKLICSTNFIHNTVNKLFLEFQLGNVSSTKRSTQSAITGWVTPPAFNM